MIDEAVLEACRMKNLLDAYGDFTTLARMTADAVAWAGHGAVRHLTAGSRGICLVCNNLQPYGHEDTLGRTGAGWHSDESRYNPGSVLRRNQPRNQARNSPAVATLVLYDIHPKRLLDLFEEDPRTGRPRRDCRYCKTLCDIFDAFFRDEYMDWRTETRNGMPIHFGLMIREGLPLIINCVNFTYDKHSWNPRVDLEVYLDLDSPQGELLGIGPVGPRAKDTRSESCMTFIKSCIQQCRTQHRLCAPYSSYFKPTRLLYIGNSVQDLRICDSISAHEQVSWVALSYCWGGYQPSRLLEGNMERLKQHIDLSDLPATFRNSIEITRELGLNYIWIDSLCILQDNKRDWEIEAARMGQVYSHAFIVVCAASSPDPQTPFLGPRQNEWLPKEFELETQNGVKLPIKVRQRSLLAVPVQQGYFEPPFTSAWASLKRIGPLYSRGWCFQETFLALRALHFAPGAVIFECKTHRRSEDQLEPFPVTHPGTLGDVPVIDQWHMIVKLYTQRQLTFGRDKLPAIGGAASSMPQASRSTYLAGLWRETLPLDLLWQVMPGAVHEGLTYDKNGQIAPSWSWASLDRGVTWNTLESPELLVEIVSAATTVNGANPFGEVAKGRICVRGCITPCFISMLRHTNEQWVHYIKKDGSSSKRQHFRADGQLMPQNNSGDSSPPARRALVGEWKTEVHASAIFLCVARTPWRNHDHVGLILSASQEFPSCFERVGSISNVPSSWYQAGKVVTLTMV